MKKVSNLLAQKGMNLERELIKVEGCVNCGKELKTYRMQIIGGSKKGQWRTITQECDCYLSQEALAAESKIKIKHFSKLSTINQSLRQATLENYVPHHDSQFSAMQKAIEFIEKLSQNKQARLIYYGEPGLGKSHIAVGIGKIVEARFRKTCMFLELPALKQMIKSSWSKESTYSERDLMRSIAEADLVILDDVGAEGITPWTKEFMFAILNSRLSKSLIVTTNMSLPDLYMEYGAKIIDRFLENMTKQDLIKIEGEHSYRLKHFIED
ncbi:ATP-binding protein [Bacillus tuaregi]|uniref:ATP-binding protein n=1 Tax=Bacillus tuaregi TaxID=1816695 RepID=UPI0008F810E9|nr:ATP-binding protein [Bacillus tuaregi]